MSPPLAQSFLNRFWNLKYHLEWFLIEFFSATSENTGCSEQTIYRVPFDFFIWNTLFFIVFLDSPWKADLLSVSHLGSIGNDYRDIGCSKSRFFNFRIFLCRNYSLLVKTASMSLSIYWHLIGTFTGWFKIWNSYHPASL